MKALGSLSALALLSATASLALASGCDGARDTREVQRVQAQGPSGIPGSARVVHPGKATFDLYCLPCHTIGGGVKNGPDLAGVTERRDRAWLERWILDPTGMAKTDPIAKQLMEEWKRFPPMAKMPVDGKVEAILDYLAEASASGAPSEPALPTLKVARASGDPASPSAAVWDEAPAIEIPLQAQNIAMPKLAQPSVDQLRLQAVSDGKVLSLRLSWPDSSPDANVDVSRFSDAVAVQFPLGEGETSPMMGNKGAPVHILYWKALWQKDIDEHFQDVQDLHPNFWTDMYWFAEGGHPHPVPAAFTDTRSHQWFVAKQAGNPGAQFERKSPVAELTAEGYGTLTPQKESAAQGKGAWAGGHWHVVMQRPLDSGDPQDYTVGDQGRLAVAVWNGGAGNVGGKKQWSNWVSFEVSK